ncbi:MAG: hypothetical protein AB8G86_12620 [Saprospiraceae bacterium]
MIPILLSLATLIVFSIVLFWDKSVIGFLIGVCAGNFGINLVFFTLFLYPQAKGNKMVVFLPLL